MTRIFAIAALLLLVCGLACGKYGPPERSRPREGPGANEGMEDFEVEMEEEDANR